MSKCRTIDRLELTRKNSRLLRNNDAPQAKAPETPEPEHHGGLCPKCGQNTLHFMEGCMTCVACGWSACGIDR